MRTCQRCGEEYPDTDIRTLCGYCMTPLASATPSKPAPSPEPLSMPASGAMLQPDVMASGAMLQPDVTIPQLSFIELTPADGAQLTMPSIALPAMPEGLTLPDAPFLPEAPTPVAMPAAEPAPQDPLVPNKPGPIRRPLTPQPHPDVPQPPLIPEPEEEPEPLVPVPAPQPVPTPAPTPEEPVPVGFTQARALPAEQVSTARAYALFFWLAATTCFFLTLVLLMRGPENGFVKFLGITATIWGGIALARQARYRGLIHAVTVTPVAPVRLGATVPFRLVVGVLNDAQINSAALVLTGVEKALEREGKTTTTHVHAFHTKPLQVKTPRVWTCGQEYAAIVAVPLPSAAPSSFNGRSYFIEWTLELHVDIANGPNIKERVVLNVLPQRQGKAALPTAAPGYHLPELGPLNAAISFTCPVTEKNMPIFRSGQQVPFALRLTPQPEMKGQRIWVELSYTILGKGEPEALAVTRQQFPIDKWIGANHEERGMLDLPLNAPPTYDGRHMHLHWSVTVRHDLPWGQDRRQVFEVLVLPMEM